MMKRMLALLLLLMMLFALPARAEETPLTLFAINVGKGDALLLNSGGDTYLIDTATAEHWGDVSRALKMLHISHLTGVILTHTDKDHAGGLMALATSSIQVDGWYASWAYTGKEKNHPMVEAADVRGETVQWLSPGDVLPLGSGKLYVVGPHEQSKEENDNSLILVAEAGGGKMLLTGDMEIPEETALLKSGSLPKSDVLKVPNHGDDDATGEDLIRAIAPKVAVISTSTAEKDTTPSDRVVRQLKAAGAQVLVTQEAESGILVTIDEGKTEAQFMGYAEFPAQAEGIAIAEVDPEEDIIRLENKGRKEVDLSGWYIVSERGGEILVLPEGTALTPGQTLVIFSDSSETKSDIRWPQKKVWHKSKDDPAVLYDVFGREMARFE